MRIALFANSSWNIWNFRMGLVGAIQAAGHEVCIIAPKDDYSQKIIDAGLAFYQVQMSTKGTDPIQDLGIIFQVKSIIKKAKIDTVLQFTIKPNIYGTIAAKLVGVPVINNVSGLGTTFIRGGLLSFIAKQLYAFAFRFPYKVFFQNTDDQSIFLNAGWVKKSQTAVLPGSGVDLLKFKPQEHHRQNPIQFLMMARLIRDKGIFEYVEAARQLKKKGVKAIFRVVGFTDFESAYGVKESVLNEWIKEGNIQFDGSTDDSAALIHSADVIVLPSYREGTSKVLLEALACGKPLIATDVPGCRETILDGQNGFLVEAKSIKSLASAMQNACEMSDVDLHKFATNSRKIAEEFFDEKIVWNHYLETIAEIELHIHK
jgi:glycosyltransferase involved in cell wall biosynthesis